MGTEQLTETCKCGRVKLEGVGRPILAACCYCADCQEAGRRFEQLPSAPRVLTPDGGTDYIVYRKDRVQCVSGAEHLVEHRLKPDSPTHRVIATCCNAPMFLDFTKGHWLTMYRDRFADGAPPVAMRVVTKDRRANTPLANDMPNYPKHSGAFVMRLMLAWAAMGFRRPKIDLSAARKSA